MSFQQGGRPSEFLEKLPADQAWRLVELTENDSKREHARFLTAFVGGVVGFLVLVGMLLYVGQVETLQDVLALFATFVGGFGGGMAWQSHRK